MFLERDEMAQKHILIIEDDIDLRESFQLILETAGYSVVEAINGQHALDMLQSSTGDLPGLILLDLMMPVMDGYQFREWQRAHPTFSQIPVVVMSADGHVEEKAARIGANDFLKKPASMQQIVETVARFIA